MPRRPRHEVTDVPQHVVQRGNNKQSIFYSGTDRRRYLHWLAQAAAEEACAIHAYVLMTNHVHLLVSPREPLAVGRMMQSLGRRYVRYLNWRRGRSGTLWEGRYKASLVKSEAYLLSCYRYIELNPVRAGMVTSPERFRWSSYHRNACGVADALVVDHPVYVALGRSDAERRQAYRDLFAKTLDAATIANIRVNLNNGGAV